MFYFQIKGLVMMKLNLHVKMAVVYQNCGCVTLIMIVVMIQMNQRTCAVNVTVQRAGNDAQDNQIIDAYQNGYFVMEKMIAVITVMKKPKTVLFVILIQILNV